MLAAPHIWPCHQMGKLWLLPAEIRLPFILLRLENVTLLLITSIQVRHVTHNDSLIFQSFNDTFSYVIQ